jgi:hypothetical protein
MILCNFLIS